MNRANVIATMLFYVGILLVILGIVLGFEFGLIKVFGQTKMGWAMFFDWALKGVISGLLFIGISEIIKLLAYIKNLLKRNQL